VLRRPRRLAWSQEDAAAQPSTACPATPLALDPLQAVDGAFDRAVAPRARAPRLDRVISVTAPWRKALHRPKCAGRRTGQPALQASGLPGADALGTRPCPDAGLCEVCLLRHALRELGCVRRVTPRWTPEHEPGSPPRGQLSVLRLHHHGPVLSRLSLPGRKALGLSEALRVASHRGLAPPGALLLEAVQQPQGIMAASVPVLQSSVFVRVPAAVPSPFVAGALRNDGAPERAKHGPLGNLELPRQRPTWPALTTHRPALLMARPPSAPTGGRLHLRGVRGRGRGDRDDPGPLWPGHRGPTARCIDGLEGGALELDNRGERCRQVLHEVTAIGPLRRRGSPLWRAVGIGLRTIARDNLAPRAGVAPVRHGLRCPVWSYGDGRAAFQGNQDRAIRRAFTDRAIIPPQDGGSLPGRYREATDGPQQRITTHGHAQLLAQRHASGPAQRASQRRTACRVPHGGSDPWDGPPRQALGADPAAAGVVVPEKLPHVQLPRAPPGPPREIGQRACVAAMDTQRHPCAARAGHLRGRRGDMPGDGGRPIINVPRLQGQWDRPWEQAAENGGGCRRNDSGFLL
jgi:hypothetical protein